MRHNQIVSGDLIVSGGTDAGNQGQRGLPFAANQPIDGRDRHPDPAREGLKGEIVSLAVARDRVHSRNVPDGREHGKLFLAKWASDEHSPLRQNRAMRGRPKSAPISHENRLYELRLRAGLTQARLGDAVGCTGQQVQKLESGRRQITQAMAHRLAKVLGVTVGEIYSAETQPAGRHEAEALRFVRALAPEQRDAWLNMAASILHTKKNAA